MRAPASVKALANDLACYATFCARAGGIGLPANEARIVAYLENCERRELKPATVGRRLASLAVVHGLLGAANPTRGSIVRDAMRGFRRRVDVTQRQAEPLRFGEGLASCAKYCLLRSQDFAISVSRTMLESFQAPPTTKARKESDDVWKR